MLFRQDILQGIAEGRVTLAFRRWRRAPPADGSSLRSPVGVLCLDRVTIVDEGDITTEDVRRTGMTADELRASVAGEGGLVVRLVDGTVKFSDERRAVAFSTLSSRSWPGSTPRARRPGRHATCS